DNGNIWFWRCDSWNTVAYMEVSPSALWPASLTFHPNESQLATLGATDDALNLWKVDVTTLLQKTPQTEMVHCSSAKILLIGESDAGKTCLAHRIAEGRFVGQNSTLGLQLWPMPADQLYSEAIVPPTERRDVILWDMGGQDVFR